MDPAAFVRFWLVKVRQTWATGGWTYPDHDDFTRPRHRIAWVAFAPYAGIDEMYLEAIWGGQWARGLRVDLRDGQVHVLDMLWIS